CRLKKRAASRSRRRPFQLLQEPAALGRLVYGSERLAQAQGDEGPRIDVAGLGEGDVAGEAVRVDGALDVEMVPDIQLRAQGQGRGRLVFGPRLEIVAALPAIG